ncbi:prolipoprotein diacylglyceryl transferase family protein [Salmonella enterica subsp. enterica serovar Falkensee]|nr:redoxin family protein [Vibrio cholerae]EGQ8445187.1 redoxin family protein [Vibrio cholerae]
MLSFSLGPLGVSTELAVIYFALIMAWLVGWLVSRKRGANPESAMFTIALVGLVTARVGFVLMYSADYQGQFLRMIDIRDGGFLPVIGFLAALFAVVFFAARQPELRYGLGIGLAVAAAVAVLGLTAVSGFKKTLGMPDAVLTDIQGNQLTLSDYKGKPVVVNLWATWCPPCIREMPVLDEAQQANQDIHFVFVNQGEDSAEVAHFLQKHKLVLDNVVLDIGGAVGQAVSSRALPTTLFYDENGTLVNSHLGELSRASLKHGLRRFDKEKEQK